MPDTSDKKEQREPRAQQESAQKRQPLLEKHFEEGAQDIVQEARQDVAVTHLPWYRSIKRAYYLLGIDVLLLVLFALLATFVHFHPVVGIDVTITREFQENQSPWLQGLMTALSYIGYQAWLSIGLVVLAVLIFWIVDLRLEAITLAAVYAVSGILTALMKIVVGRPRPSAGLVEVFRTLNDQSFPSGHVMSYVAFWGMLFIFGIILLTVAAGGVSGCW